MEEREGEIRARILGGARRTAIPKRRPVAKPPMCEKLSRPGSRPSMKHTITCIRRIASCRFGF